jgi:translation initiation factor IF-3
MDYGKYKYEQMKKEQKQRARAKKVEVKGVRISLRISQNDLEFKARQADKFLKEGNKVRIELVLQGRELARKDLSKAIFDKFIQTMKEKITIEQRPKRQRLGLAMIVTKAKN